MKAEAFGAGVEDTSGGRPARTAAFEVELAQNIRP